jgi:CheY-like chemotaxis protein
VHHDIRWAADEAIVSLVPICACPAGHGVMNGRETSRLNGLRVLVVEDEAMVSMLLEDILGEFGCEVVGPAFSLQQATSLASSEPALGAAILDVNLRGAPIYPVAAILAQRSVPFVFATGYGPEGLDESWRGRPKLQKPFSAEQVETALLTAIAEVGPARPSFTA